jgi:hypothetical protein
LNPIVNEPERMEVPNETIQTLLEKRGSAATKEDNAYSKHPRKKNERAPKRQ